METGIKGASPLVYPCSDGEPMAESDWHRDLMMDFIFMLKRHFKDRTDVHVSGNLLMYYEEGNIYKSVAPDVFVVFGVGKHPRRTFQTWVEGATPDFVLEVTSPETYYRKDITRKKALYATLLGVREYYLYDPYHEVVPHFQAYRLVGWRYQPMERVGDRFVSEVLGGLELGEHKETLRLYDPRRSEWLLPPEERIEAAEARIAQNREARHAAEKRITQDRQAWHATEKRISDAKTRRKK